MICRSSGQILFCFLPVLTSDANNKANVGSLHHSFACCAQKKKLVLNTGALNCSCDSRWECDLKKITDRLNTPDKTCIIPTNSVTLDINFTRDLVIGISKQPRSLLLFSKTQNSPLSPYLFGVSYQTDMVFHIWCPVRNCIQTNQIKKYDGLL